MAYRVGEDGWKGKGDAKQSIQAKFYEISTEPGPRQQQQRSRVIKQEYERDAQEGKKKRKD